MRTKALSLTFWGGILALAVMLAYTTAHAEPPPPLNLESHFTPNPIGASAQHCQHSRLVREVADMIDNATSSVYTALYYLDCPTIEQALVDALGRGLDVVVVTDTDNLEDFHDLIDAGVRVEHGNRSNQMHHKFFIIDRKHTVTGGMNYTSTGTTCNANHTMIFRDDVNIASWFYGEFRRMAHEGLFGNSKPILPPMTASYADGVTVSLLFAPHNSVEDITHLLRDGRVYHIGLFGITLDEWATAIIDNAYINEETGWPGKEVTAVFDATGKGWRGTDFYRIKAVYGNDVAVEPFTCKMHLKLIAVELVDGTKCVIDGSANFSTAGTTGGNDENMFVVCGHDRLYEEVTTYVEGIYNGLPAFTKAETFPIEIGEMSPSACDGDERDNDYDGLIDMADDGCHEVTYVDCHDGIDNDGDRLIDLEDESCWYWLLYPYVPRVEDVGQVDVDMWHIYYPDYLQNMGGMTIAFRYGDSFGEPMPFDRDMSVPLPLEVEICAMNDRGMRCASGDPTPQPNVEGVE